MSEEMFKPGVCVDIREASESEIDQIIAKAIASGARLGSHNGDEYVKWENNSGSWVWKSFDSTTYPVISVDEALGRNKVSSWIGGEGIPPVGTVCEVTHAGIRPTWGKIEILKHDLDYRGGEGDKGRIACMALSEHFGRSIEELFWLANPYDPDVKFRPIRAEKDIFVERFCKELIYDKVIAEEAYALGIRFIKEKA